MELTESVNCGCGGIFGLYLRWNTIKKMFKSVLNGILIGKKSIIIYKQKSDLLLIKKKFSANKNNLSMIIL